MSKVFPEGEQLQSAFEVFEKKCELNRAPTNEEVPRVSRSQSCTRTCRMPSSGRTPDEIVELMVDGGTVVSTCPP